MSIRLMNDAWDTDLHGALKLVLLTLCDFADDAGGNCWPAVSTIAAKASMSERQTQRILRQLEESALIGIDGNTGGGGRGMTRRYRINTRRLANMAGDARASRETEKGVNLSPFSGEERVTNCHPLEEERVTSEAERVTSETQKGDMDVTRPTINHHKSIQERAACAPAREAPDPDAAPPCHSAQAEPQDPSASALIEFPADWQPCAISLELLKQRQMPKPAQWVIDKFVGYWVGKRIAQRQIPGEFLKWVARERGMNRGKVPTDGDFGAGDHRSDAEAAWVEVRRMNQSGQGRPAQGWSHPNTEAALREIGGLSRLADMLTRDVPFRQKEFIAAYIEAASSNQDSRRRA